MKVLLVNGSPHKEGCTYTALTTVAVALKAENIGADIFWIGNKPLSGCIACKSCIKMNACVFHDTVNEFLDMAGDSVLPSTGAEPPVRSRLSWTGLSMPT